MKAITDEISRLCQKGAEGDDWTAVSQYSLPVAGLIAVTGAVLATYYAYQKGSYT